MAISNASWELEMDNTGNAGTSNPPALKPKAKSRENLHIKLSQRNTCLQTSFKEGDF